MARLHNQYGWIWQGQLVQSDLIEKTASRVNQQIEAGNYSLDEMKYIAAINEMPVKGKIRISPEKLEKLRRLCQVWEVNLSYNKITSHRRLIGPLIVLFKKLFYPVVQALFKDFIRQQKEFNAATIALLADLSNDGEEG